MRERARFVAALLAALAASCGAPRSRYGAPQAGWHAAASAEGTWRMRWRGEPDPPLVLETGRILVEAARADGETPDELRADAGMPEHGHGLLRRLRVKPLGSGRFAVENVYLHMPGRWLVYLDLGRDGIFERVEIALEID